MSVEPRGPTTEELRARVLAATAPEPPPFETCGNCGADAEGYCRFDPAHGWCCSACGACDSDE